MYCFRVFTFASQYIAHAGSHRDADATKDSFISRICDRLRKRVDDELCSLLGRSLGLPNENSAQKRSIEVADLGSMIPAAQTTIPRPDSYGVNEAITNAVAFHDFIGRSPHVCSVASVLTIKKILDFVATFRPPFNLSLLLHRCPILRNP